MTQPGPMPAPNPIAPAPAVPIPGAPARPTAARTAPATPTLALDMVPTAQEALLNRPDTSLLPGDVQTQVNTFYAALQAAQGAYNILAQGYPQIWESGQYPTDYRRQQAELFMERVFEKQGLGCVRKLPSIGKNGVWYDAMN